QFQAGASQALNTTTNQISFVTSPTLVNSVIRGATTLDTTSVTGNSTGYNLASAVAGGVGFDIVPLPAGYTTLPASGASSTVNYVVPSGTTTITASETVNS